MTITQGQQCQSINIDSLNLLSTNQSVVLNVSYNCVLVKTVEISPAFTSIELLPEDLSMDTVFTDGIYGFELSIIKESKSYFKNNKIDNFYG